VEIRVLYTYFTVSYSSYCWVRCYGPYTEPFCSTWVHSDFFLIGSHKRPVYTAEEKILDNMLCENSDLNNFIFPCQSPASISADPCFSSQHHRYVIFELTLNVDKLNQKLLQLERLVTFLTARFLYRLSKIHQRIDVGIYPSGVQNLIDCVKVNAIDRIDKNSLSPAKLLTLTSVGYAGFCMPHNVENNILQLLTKNVIDENVANSCNYYFLKTLLNNGRLLFYHVNDTNKSWRELTSASLLLLTKRICDLEILEKSLKNELFAVVDKQM